MCLAVPGKILASKDGRVVVRCAGDTREAIAKGIVVKEGDYVLIQFGIVVQKLAQEEALQAIKDWEELSSQHQ